MWRKQHKWTEEAVLLVRCLIFYVSWPSKSLLKVQRKATASQRPLLAFVTNFSVRSSIRLLFLSLHGESKRGSSETDWRRNASVLVAVNRHFSSIETYCSSASAILSRSHVLDCDGCVRDRQSCGKSSRGFLRGKCALFLCAKINVSHM